MHKGPCNFCLLGVAPPCDDLPAGDEDVGDGRRGAAQQQARQPRAPEYRGVFDVEGDETDDEDDAVSAVVCVNEHCWVVIELADYATVLQQ